MSELLEASLKTLTGTIDNIESAATGYGGIEANNKSVVNYPVPRAQGVLTIL